MSDKELRAIVGLVLWWTEGTKKRRDLRRKNQWIYQVEITNTDPSIITIFLDFIRSDVGVKESKLKVQLQIHEGDNKNELEQYWSNITKIPLNRFQKTIIRPAGNKPGKTSGTCKIRYNSKETFEKLEELLLHKIQNKLLK